MSGDVRQEIVRQSELCLGGLAWSESVGSVRFRVKKRVCRMRRMETL